MHLLFDIFQGIGVAAAAGIRPFLSGLAAGALAAGNVEIHFDHTDYSFLQSAPFLLALAVLAIVLALVERRRGATERREMAGILALFAVVVGALFFAGSLCRGGYAVWPGLIGGAVCALIGAGATVPLLRRVRGRLDADAAGALPVYAEGAALLIAALSVVAPPVGPIVLLALLWLLIAGRGRGEQKYAGLRILR